MPGAGAEHLLYADEVTWSDYVDADSAMPVETAGITTAINFMENVETGPGGRGRQPGAPGESTINGPINLKLRPTMTGFWLRTMYAERAQVAAGTGWRNKLLVDDDVDIASISIEKRYSSTVAEFIRGAKLNSYQVNVRGREWARLATNWVARDSVGAGGLWADQTAAPTVTVDPVPLYGDASDPLKFYQGVLRIGGTVAKTAGELIVTGGTDRCDFDTITADINNNIATDAFGVCLDEQTVQSLDLGPRVVTLGFEPNFATVGLEFYNMWRSLGTAVMELFFQGPIFDTTFHYQMKWTFPNVRLTNAPNPELNAAYGLKRVTVAAQAFAHPTLGDDHGLVIQTSDDLVP